MIRFTKSQYVAVRLISCINQILSDTSKQTTKKQSSICKIYLVLYRSIINDIPVAEDQIPTGINKRSQNGKISLSNLNGPAFYFHKLKLICSCSETWRSTARIQASKIVILQKPPTKTLRRWAGTLNLSIDLEIYVTFSTFSTRLSLIYPGSAHFWQIKLE